MTHLVDAFMGFSIYTWIMFANLAILLIVLILGGDFDFGDVDIDADIGDVGSGVSPLSLPVVAMFGASFGGFASVFDSIHWPVVAVVLPSFILAALIAGGMYFVLYKVFSKTQISSDVVMPELIGREASVNISIGPGKTGQVLVITAERGRTLLPAVSSEEIPTDSVVVIENVAGNSVRVRRKEV